MRERERKIYIYIYNIYRSKYGERERDTERQGDEEIESKCVIELTGKCGRENQRDKEIEIERETERERQRERETESNLPRYITKTRMKQYLAPLTRK